MGRDSRSASERAVTEERLADGYRQRAERDRRLAEEMASVSREADEELGDAPDW